MKINSFRQAGRTGLTLIEIMIALTVTLIVLGAMAQAFKFASGEIAQGRAVLEMSNQLRNAQQLLRTDLAGLTVDVRPHTESTPNGYFEYIEGPLNDSSALGSAQGYLGDIDDILAFTSRNLDGSFRGRFLGQTLQSSFAEIVWFTDSSDQNADGIPDPPNINDVAYTNSIALHRRVLLIRPNLNDTPALPFDTGEDNGNPIDSNPALQAAAEFFIDNDISARWVDSDNDGFRDSIVANSLSDLARRENRFCRDSTIFPHNLIRTTDTFSTTAPFYTQNTIDLNLRDVKAGAANISGGTFTRDFSGDDIVLTDLAAFDVRIFSPTAGVNLVDIDGNGEAETLVESSDIGFVAASSSPSGGFIDLAIVANAFSRLDPHFSTAPTTRSGLSITNPFSSTGLSDTAYCTWSPHYESDGINQDGDGLTDEGTNGLDDDNQNGVDDDGELETAPPYPFPVRGIEVTFRIVEKKTKQVRQTSVVQNFLPQ